MRVSKNHTKKHTFLEFNKSNIKIQALEYVFY